MVVMPTLNPERKKEEKKIINNKFKTLFATNTLVLEKDI
jgi:hypothetical protein